MLEFSSRLHVLLLAPYPLLHIETWEEARTLALLSQLAGAMGRAVQIWRPEDYSDPVAGLIRFVRHATEEQSATLWVAIDAHPYLSDHAVVRRLRLASRRLHETGGTLILVGPTIDAPPEVAREFTSLVMPLPDAGELDGILGVVLDEPPALAGIDRGRAATAALGLTSAEAHRAYERARRMHEFEAARGRTFDFAAGVIDEKRRLLASDRALEFHSLDTDMNGVGGLDELKLWLHERRDAFGRDARTFGLPMPRGALLLGVQGCGKSLAARAIAGYWGLPLLRLDVSALFSGDTPADSALQAALRSAAAISPCVLWVDEIEKGFTGDQSADARRLLGSLLIWLQQKQAPVFFVATANDVRTMPPELFRRGRFDEIFFVDLPDHRARTEILALHLRARRRDPASFDLEELARVGENYSGAELEQAIVAAMYTAFAEKRDVAQADLLAALRATVPLYAMYETEIKALRTWANGRARPAGRNRKLSDLFARQPG